MLISYIENNFQKDYTKIKYIVEALWNKTDIITDYPLIFTALLSGEQGYENIEELDSEKKLILI